MKNHLFCCQHEHPGIQLNLNHQTLRVHRCQRWCHISLLVRASCSLVRVFSFQLPSSSAGWTVMKAQERFLFNAWRLQPPSTCVLQMCSMQQVAACSTPTPGGVLTAGHPEAGGGTSRFSFTTRGKSFKQACQIIVDDSSCAHFPCRACVFQPTSLKLLTADKQWATRWPAGD